MHRFAKNSWKALMLVLLLAPLGLIRAEESLVWRTNSNRIDAEISSWPLQKLLEKISAQTGWKVFIEPGTRHDVSVKFRNLPLGNALRSLLGNLNFALVPETNGASKLFVFRTSVSQATQLVAAGKTGDANKKSSRIANEIIVTLKPGANIDAIARALGAKVTGRIDELNTYRLQFESAEAADAARAALANNPDVASLDSNFQIPRPAPMQNVLASSTPDFNLKTRAPGDCSIVVGLVDTSMQKLGGNLDSFVMTPISVAEGGSAAGSVPTHATTMAQTLLLSLQNASGGQTSVKILPVDVYGRKETTSTFDVANGVYRAINSGANVINLSLGSDGDSTVLHNLITSATQKGIVFFAAAGNEPVTTPYYPAAYSEVTAVTAGDRRGQIANYANRGDFVDVVGPGSSIVNFNGQTWFVSGTSAATAFVTGMAAGLADAKRICPEDVVPSIRNQLAVGSP
jgi:hypothetical protein